MRKVIIPIVVGLLLFLAILPWLVTSCNPQSLVPNDLLEGPLHYEATVTAAQVATIDAGRAVTSVIKIFPVGTADLSTIETDSPSTSIVKIMTATIIASSSFEPNSVNTPIYLIETPTPIFNNTNESDGVPATPIGLIDIEDIITEEQLTEQLKTEPEGSELKDLKVALSQSGFRIDGILAISPVSNQDVEIHGVFIIKSYSLVVDILSITLNGDDVTSSFHEEIESRMDTSLYRLLPERYVQDFMVVDGKLLVTSKARK